MDGPTHPQTGCTSPYIFKIIVQTVVLTIVVRIIVKKVITSAVPIFLNFVKRSINI